MHAGQVWDSMESLQRLYVFDKGPRQTLDISIYVGRRWQAGLEQQLRAGSFL